ncbi:MAG: sensor histidine kinase [Acutalibacteraceae bacterium]
MENLNNNIELNVGLLWFSAVITLFMLFGTVTDRTRNRPFMKCFIALLAANIIMLIGESGLWIFGGSPDNIPVLKLSAFLSFGTGAVLEVLYAYCLTGFVRERQKVSWKYANVIAVIGAVYFCMVVISLFNGILFDFDSNGCYVDGQYYFIVRLLDSGILLLEILMVMNFWKILKLKSTVHLLSFSVLPLLAMPLLSYWDPTPLLMATTVSLLMIFMLFRGELTRQLSEKEIQIIEKDKELAQKERQITESRISTMISQIQPHFIYNTLGTIHQLCLEQPEKAAELTQNFSKYLRGNFSELTNSVPIRFSQELNHIKCYMNIEQVRFPDIEIEYDLKAKDFNLPALSVQPLVENAVKHGLMGLESGGKITVSTYETDTDYCVCVKDNGVGFDKTLVNDKKKHIGIQNIYERVRTMCDGNLTVESTIGKGTTALITIPKEETI